MTHDEWIEAYEPIQNHIDTNASFDGQMFETFGPELEFVCDTIDPGCVWTYVEGDEGQALIVNGYHHVNRLGYFITAKPCLEDDICIDLDDD